MVGTWFFMDLGDTNGSGVVEMHAFHFGVGASLVERPFATLPGAASLPRIVRSEPARINPPAAVTTNNSHGDWVYD
jgi:hypothetical protein